MNNLIKRSNDILLGVGRCNGIKKECRMGNTRNAGLNPEIKVVRVNTEQNFETFSLYTIAEETTNLIGIFFGKNLEVR